MNISTLRTNPDKLLAKIQSDLKEVRHREDKRINPLIAGVTGAVIAAGVTVAATKVLSDNKTRNKLKHTLSDAKTQAIDYVRSMNKPKKVKKITKMVKKSKKTDKK